MLGGQAPHQLECSWDCCVGQLRLPRRPLESFGGRSSSRHLCAPLSGRSLQQACKASDLKNATSCDIKSTALLERVSATSVTNHQRSTVSIWQQHKYLLHNTQVWFKGTLSYWRSKHNCHSTWAAAHGLADNTIFSTNLSILRFSSWGFRAIGLNTGETAAKNKIWFEWMN